MSFQWAIRAALLAAAAAAPAYPVSVTPFVNMGGYSPNEMTIDRATGDIYLSATAGSSSTLSIVKVTAGNLTGIVDRLHAEGLVRRSVHPADRRAFRLTLTPKGRRLVRRAQRRHHRVLTALLAGMPARDLRVLRRLLDRLRASASSRVARAAR